MCDALDAVRPIDTGPCPNEYAEAVRNGGGITLDGDAAFARIALRGRPVGGGLLLRLGFIGFGVAVVVAGIDGERGAL